VFNTISYKHILQLVIVYGCFLAKSGSFLESQYFICLSIAYVNFVVLVGVCFASVFFFIKQ
jgi:hypothetical protein